MASWKIVPQPSEVQVELTSFHQARSFFAVDASKSTAWNNAMNSERDFVKAVPGSRNRPGVQWGSACGSPSRLAKVKWRPNLGGTNPSSILRSKEALECIKKSDCWYLLTDGEIYSSDVSQLAQLAMDQRVANVPLVFVVVGSRGRTPESLVWSPVISILSWNARQLPQF